MDRQTRPEGVGVTGWLCALAGGILAITGATFALVGALARTLSQEGGDVFAQAGVAMDPLSRALLEHFEMVAAILVAFGLASLVIGVQFLRMRPAARTALEVLGWVALVGTAALEAFSLIAWRNEGDRDSTASWLASPVTSLILSVLQVIACILMIRFVRSAPVKEAFRGETQPGR